MSGVPDDDGEPEAPLYYAARLLLSHPDMDPARISEGLDRVPRHVHRAGDKIVTPDGSEPGGRWYDTRWSIGWDHLGDERVFAFAETILDGLAPKTAFLKSLRNRGRLSCSTTHCILAPAHQEHLSMPSTVELRSVIRVLETFREVDPEITLPTMLAFC